MGSSCINNDNNKYINHQMINITEYSKENHDSQYQNKYNKKINENSEYLITNQQISQINENTNNTTNNINISNNNYTNQNIIISEPTFVLSSSFNANEENNYTILIIKETDNEKKILNKLYDLLDEKEDNINKNDVTIKYNNGETFIGELDEEKIKNGRGIQIFNNNNIYYGYWKNNKKDGIGKMIKFNQKINDLNIIFDDNSIPFYYGNWKNDLEDGIGEEMWIDKSSYKGEYKEGYREGKGILLLADGTEYDGDFSHGKIEGMGKITYKDGRVYEGYWLNNKMNGQGEFKWPDGRIFRGNYLNDYKNGYGEFFWPNGKIYKGMWINGKQNGKGKLYNKEYDFWITGIWKDGKRIKDKN